MNILLLGSGGREHALAWKIAQSPLCNTLFIAPGNAGTQACGTNVPLSNTDFRKIGEFVIENTVELVVVGPEEPLVRGLGDYFRTEPALSRVAFLGPGSQGAALEGSKDFAKKFMMRHQIPTASYRTFHQSQLAEAKKYLEQFSPPYVLKADGLAAGKGVVIPDTLESAYKELEEMLAKGKFGEAGNTVVIEEFLKGMELSVFVLTDGKDYVILPEAKDYKRAGDNDSGPNTGGMGSVSPVPFAGRDFMKKVEERIVQPTVRGLQKDGIPYTGFIFIGLMNVKGDPFVIEYNVRMGDPETESVIPRIRNDLAALLLAAASGKLAGKSVEVAPETAVTVVAVSGGYPGEYRKGKAIHGTDKAEGSLVFHAGTMEKDGVLLSNGGRVLAVTSLRSSIEEARDATYRSLRNIAFDDMQYRKDIGKDLMTVNTAAT